MKTSLAGLEVISEGYAQLTAGAVLMAILAMLSLVTDKLSHSINQTLQMLYKESVEIQRLWLTA